MCLTFAHTLCITCCTCKQRHACLQKRNVAKWCSNSNNEHDRFEYTGTVVRVFAFVHALRVRETHKRDQMLVISSVCRYCVS